MGTPAAVNREPDRATVVQRSMLSCAVHVLHAYCILGCMMIPAVCCMVSLRVCAPLRLSLCCVVHDVGCCAVHHATLCIMLCDLLVLNASSMPP
jgi:hypothetical protein